MGGISITGLVAALVQRALVVAVLGDVARDVPGVVVGAVVGVVVDVAEDSEILFSIISLACTNRGTYGCVFVVNDLDGNCKS